MFRGKRALRWLSWALLLVTGCRPDPCEKAAPTVLLELRLAGISPTDVRSLEILLDAGSDRFRRVYNLEDELSDGRTSISIEIVPAPEAPFELGVEVRAFDGRDAGGTLIGSRLTTMEAQPNGCNEAAIQVNGTALPDAGPPTEDAGDAGPRDAEVADADAPDAEVDAGIAEDAGCTDDDLDGVCDDEDNCPGTPNPLQEDTDGVAAIPIPFAPIPIQGQPVPGVVGDDIVSLPVPIPFGFEFFGVARSELRVSSNGFLGFRENTSPPDGCCIGQAIPDAQQPNNLVALAWQDLEVLDADSVKYEVVGAEPDRRFVLQFQAVPLCCGPGVPSVTVQAILFEGSHRIEIHTTEQPGEDGFTRGVESPNGTRAAFLPGEAQATFSLFQDAVSFTTGTLPDGIGDACSNAR